MGEREEIRRFEYLRAREEMSKREMLRREKEKVHQMRMYESEKIREENYWLRKQNKLLREDYDRMKIAYRAREKILKRENDELRSQLAQAQLQCRPSALDPIGTKVDLAASAEGLNVLAESF